MKLKLHFLLFAAALLLSGPGYAQSGAPVIEKIDPPNWWADMPSPMLLIRGEHLSGTRIAVSGNHVLIEKTQISQNGDWAFVWLRTANASPQTLHITIANQEGKAEAGFQ